MKDFVQKFWTPIAGLLSSISVKGISDISTPVIEEAPNMATPVHPPELITYLWIGVLGGLGGLLVKILWGIIKKWFPKLKSIDG